MGLINRIIAVAQQPLTDKEIKRNQPGQPKGVPGRISAAVIEYGCLSQVNSEGQAEGAHKAQAAAAVVQCAPAKGETAQPPGDRQRAM